MRQTVLRLAAEDPGAVIHALCSGPKTVYELARCLGTRPTCLAAMLTRLLSLGVVRRERRTGAGSDPLRARRVLLAIDPAAAWVMVAAQVTLPEKNAPKPLRGSLALLQNEAARFDGDSPASNSSPHGAPAQGAPEKQQ